MSHKNLEAWPENSIYSSIKILVSFELKIVEKSDIMIDFVQPIFETVFGYSLSNLPMQLNSLISVNNDREDIADLYLAIISGRPKSLFVNLTSLSGNILSCFISMICSTTKQTEHLSFASLTQKHRKFAVMTIRSASAIGNTRFIGVGICSINGVDLNILEDRVGKERNELQPHNLDSTITTVQDVSNKKRKTNVDNYVYVQHNYNDYSTTSETNDYSKYDDYYITADDSFCNAELLSVSNSSYSSGVVSYSGNTSPSYEMLSCWNTTTNNDSTTITPPKSN